YNEKVDVYAWSHVVAEMLSLDVVRTAALRPHLGRLALFFLFSSRVGGSDGDGICKARLGATTRLRRKISPRRMVLVSILTQTAVAQACTATPNFTPVHSLWVWGRLSFSR
ncbi:unnamed protein product, partial [Scytosiphon promiscuus]